MKNRIEHETLPLKEEKHLIREIEQLQQQCKHISSNVGKQGEVLQALDQKDQIEEHSKVHSFTFYFLPTCVTNA